MSDEIVCPVCKDHTQLEAFESQGLVLSGVRATFDRDVPLIKQIADELGPYEAHVAITMFALLMANVCDEYGDDPYRVLGEMQAYVNGAQAEL